jgi:adenine-specific DNA-methyltransferase
MDVNLGPEESLEAEVERLRRQNADLLAAREARRLGLVWERNALPAEDDAAKSFVPDLVIEEDGVPVSMPENDPGNVIIEGNNIAALRILGRTHAGAFDCILIDPPYGTGNTTWLYNDRFVDSRNRFRDSAWLSWIEPRLECARDLLSPSGCLLVCIDDTKRALLDLLMEQVMPGKRIGSIVWRTRQGANDRGIKNLSIDHEHLLVYGNADFEFGGSPKTYELYRHYDEGSADPYRISDLTVNVAWDDKRAGNAYYPLHDPKTDAWYPCNPNAVWRFGSQKFLKSGKKNRKDTMEQLVAKGRVVFPKGRRVEVWSTRADLDAAIATEDVPRNGKQGCSTL